ncbi:acyltransferase domain-containing protein [Bacillus spizizenii]|uniref:acyltransferase domain-containing protein n=1 Tax=Bacillus spizizenii TaxID=96241 RepID=UPI00228300B6|nr:acyltransferase domain-containing protein [Bacillus spizizenii]MCY8866368.1 acyltransferase domain-containing protein [Bacillus spizizenii]MEC0582276.1 acyltransferase domain-containing protein [Bacillus spizizenii]MEC1595191.1 acyltransferase domain-containing protein [Bacillus spizizenii]
MNEPLVFMFSGQGSQYYHMGKELFKENIVFRQSMHEMDAMAARRIGTSIVEEIYHPAKRVSDPFDSILFSHPAIFMVEYSLYKVLEDRGIYPDYVLGSSLGEFASAAVSGVSDAENILDCILEQAIVIQKSCDKGKMLAILDKPQLLNDHPQLFGNSELISINYDSHFVISGEEENIKHIMGDLKEKQILCQLLPVSYAFHSSLIDPAESAYAEFLKSISFKNPSIPVVSSLTGSCLHEMDKHFFWNAVREPMRFREAIRYLESQHTCRYIDLGPSGTLAAFVKQLIPGDSANRCCSIMTPFHQELKNLNTVECFRKPERKFTR